MGIWFDVLGHGVKEEDIRENDGDAQAEGEVEADEETPLIRDGER